MSTPNTKKYTPFGFTLVELIVVITILVILGTIAFTSLAGYSGSARDSSRISDLTNISKGLDIAYAKTSSYPMPDSYFTVTYSGGNVWYQGEVGTTVMNILTSAGAKLSKQPPLDPLVTTAKYTYSKVAYAKDSYQMKSDWEGDKISYNHNPGSLALSTSSPALLLAGEGSKDIPPLLLGEDRGEVKELSFITQAQAASGNPTISYIVGNYNGVVAKTQTGTMTYILAVPSIISNTGSIGLILAIDSAQKTLSGALLTNGGSNITGVTYNPVVAYASTSLPSTISEKTALATIIATTYSGTSLAYNSNIQSYITAYVANDTTALVSLGGNAGTSVGGGSVVSTTPTVPPSVYSSGSSTTAFTPGMQFSYSGVTVTVTSAGVGLSSSTYAGCDTPDIVIWASGYNPQIWAACNIGATTSAGFATVPIQNPVTSVDAMTLPSNRVANVQGNYYQWGRNDNVTTYTFAGTGVTYTGVLSSPANTTSTTLFYGGDATYGDWKWAGAVNPAGGWNTLNTGDNTFLCASGYHIPTTDATVNSDWKKASQLIVGTISPAGVQFNTIRSTLKLPMAGVRNGAGLYSSQGLGAYYWSSSTTGGGSYYVLFWAGGGMYTNSTRVYGYTVRCIKN